MNNDKFINLKLDKLIVLSTPNTEVKIFLRITEIIYILILPILMTLVTLLKLPILVNLPALLTLPMSLKLSALLKFQTSLKLPTLLILHVLLILPKLQEQPTFLKLRLQKTSIYASVHARSSNVVNICRMHCVYVVCERHTFVFCFFLLLFFFT